MGFVARYLTHPEVMINPNVRVTGWGLSTQGSARIARLVAGKAFAGTTRVVSSAERKAIETAEPIAASLGLCIEVWPRMHENDHSATGYLQRDEFEAVADRFFAAPSDSVRGWERAVDAQRRIVSEVSASLTGPQNGDVLYVGHGGVGTLLRCWLANLPIEGTHDQPGEGGGCIFSFSLSDGKPLSGWSLIEDL